MTTVEAVSVRHDGHRVKRLDKREAFCFDCFEDVSLDEPASMKKRKPLEVEA